MKALMKKFTFVLIASAVVVAALDSDFFAAVDLGGGQSQNAANISGNTKVIDGDSLVVDGVEIRLQSIDAPEYDQPCLRYTLRSCGAMATDYLRNTIINGGTVTCTISKKDNYNRALASCSVNGKDIEQQMVQNGYANAYRYYSKKYIKEEEQAKTKEKGLWQHGGYEEPYHYRKRNR